MSDFLSYNLTKTGGRPPNIPPTNLLWEEMNGRIDGGAIFLWMVFLSLVRLRTGVVLRASSSRFAENLLCLSLPCQV